MTKQEFLDSLKSGLQGLPSNEIDERLSFYSEIIDDRIEEGVSEEDAVSEIGDVNTIVTQIITDTPFLTIAKEKIKPNRKMKTWEIVLLAIGSPIWISLLIAALAVVFSVYVSLWSIIVSLWSVFASLVGGALGGILAGITLSITNDVVTGVIMISAALVCSGFSILTFCCCKLATKGILILTKKISLCTKNSFMKKEEA